MPQEWVKRHRHYQSDRASIVLVHNSSFRPNFTRLDSMDCRPHCGACCIAPSISSPIPGVPNGKPVGVYYVQLDDANGYRIFSQPERPAVRGSLQPAPNICRGSAMHTMQFLARLELATAAH